MAIIQLTEKHRERLREYIVFLSNSDRFNPNEKQWHSCQRDAFLEMINILYTILDDNQYDDDELILAYDVGFNYDNRIMQTRRSLLNKLEKFFICWS